MSQALVTSFYFISQQGVWKLDAVAEQIISFDCMRLGSGYVGQGIRSLESYEIRQEDKGGQGQ